jgi:hypothetical protein
MNLFVVPDDAHGSSALSFGKPMIITASWNRALCVCLALPFGAAGCGPSSVPPDGKTAAPRPPSVSAGNGATFWIRNPNLRPGMDEAAVDMCSWDGELVFAVWADVRASAGGSQQTATGQAYFGAFPTADGRQLEYRGETTDGRTGEVVFHTKDQRTNATVLSGRYDLSEGSLFLVSVGGKQPRVLQLKHDIRKAESENFQKLAETDAEIGKFFTREGP